MTKAFDTVWRPAIIIQGLERLACSHSLICLVQSFLEDRKVSFSAWTATAFTFSQLGTPRILLSAAVPVQEVEDRRGMEPPKGVLDRLRFLPIKNMDQRSCIKFSVKNEIKCADAFRMLTLAYGEATLDRSNVYRWYKMFSEGREDVNDEERAGRPSNSKTDEKIDEVEKMILGNRRITVREVAEDLNISIGSCDSNFINDLGMRRVAAKFVPKLLNCDQKQHRMNIANEMLDSVRDDPNLLQRVITGDEAGVVHHEFLPQGRTVNKEYYLQVLRNLREAIRQKRPDLWKNKNWLLHHDNAHAHTSLLVRDFLAKPNTLMMPQPPYSPDLAPYMPSVPKVPAGLIQPIPASNYPFERIGVDFLGPLPSTRNRKRWIVVLTDYYTKYAETKAVLDDTAKEVAKFLTEDIFLRRGAPRYLISDRGRQFTSNMMKELMKICKIND
ncbi:hypothetical protein LAZ67_2002856 [Cordylochernes scorpioides]|uniref:Integrase catalytic domain-containing protein n=1 Tax=Cordylochernes scorpioides TaxID=51811 RepID=A0ABY6K3Z2_9ARAC|nr:hypothetical protein LAZ67_2002856 [Cordylochernes scorpioides]